MDIVTLAHQIDEVSREIQRLSSLLDTLGQEAARAEAEYDKAVAIALVKLKNGVEMNVFGLKVQGPPAATAEKIAKGICYEQRLQATLADNGLKACQMKLRAAMAVLSGRQSKNKYLEIEP